MDNGSEFAGKVMDRWTCENGGRWISPGLVRRRTMRWWSAPTANCGRSAWTTIDSCRWPMQGAKSKRGGASTSRSTPTVHSHGKSLRNSPENTGPKRIPRRQKRAKSLPADGPAIGGGSQKQRLGGIPRSQVASLRKFHAEAMYPTSDRADLGLRAVGC